MAVKMRLRRMGQKKAPFYRVVVADERSPRDGRFIAEVGIYDEEVACERCSADRPCRKAPRNRRYHEISRCRSMKELVEVIAKALVDHPDQVTVKETEREDAIVVELSVAPTDMGKVIGKSGKIARAIRSVVKAASVQSEKKVIVEIE